MEKIILQAALVVLAVFAIFSAMFIAMVILTLPYLAMRQVILAIWPYLKRLKPQRNRMLVTMSLQMEVMARQMTVMQTQLTLLLQENAKLQRQVQAVAATKTASTQRRVVQVVGKHSDDSSLQRGPVTPSTQIKKRGHSSRAAQAAIVNTALDYFKAEIGKNWGKAEQLAYGNAIWVVKKLKLFKNNTRLSVAQAKAAYERAFWFAVLCQRATNSQDPVTALKTYCCDLVVSLRKLQFDVHEAQVGDLFSQGWA